MVEALAQNTNEYSFQERGTSVNTTAKEIEKMLGMYLKMGLTILRLDQLMFLQACDSLMWLQVGVAEGALTH
ncbi:hypothetical protein NHX12_015428 [Muraenolepis orangiensis]|uniref:Uncharacterized protein n=1 Tax=Muraenolepis orangiensis TaxID=630683 RepID=A0A9Q0I539_9TELE|nr:hypothetical protein NHX12_015428 [Muraenolepis orangiensis]